MHRNSAAALSLSICGLFLISSIFVGGVEAANASFSPTKTLAASCSTATKAVCVPVIATSDSGKNVYIAWEDESSGQAKTFFRASQDFGVNFGTTIQFAPQGNAHQVRIYASGENNVYLTWVQRVSGQKEIFAAASHDGGLTFNTVDGINISNSPGNSLSQAMGAWGNWVHVVWLDISTGFNRVWYSRSSDGGNTWSTPLVMSTIGGREPEIAVWQNNVYIVWASGIRFRVSHDNGANWGSETSIAASSPCCVTGANREPKITATGSNVYIVWPFNSQGYTPGNYETMLACSTDMGASFKVHNVSNSTGPSREPNVAAYGSKVYVTWWDGSIPGHNTDQYVIGSQDACHSFGTFTNLADNTGGIVGFGQVKAWGTNVYVVWPDDNPGNHEIFFSTSQDNGVTYTWQNLSNTPGESIALRDPGNELDMVAAAGTHVYVVWEDVAPNGVHSVLFRAGTA